MPDRYIRSIDGKPAASGAASAAGQTVTAVTRPGIGFAGRTSWTI